MHFLFPILAALFATAVAQSTVNLFLDQGDGSQIYASILGSSAQITTYSMLCSPTSSATIATATRSRNEGDEGDGEDEDSACDVANMTLTQGLSTVDYAFTYSDTISLSVNCKLGGTTSASCVFAQSQSGEAFTTSASLEGSEVAAAFAPVTLIGNVKGGAITAASGGSVEGGIASKTGSGGARKTGTGSVLASSGAGNSTMTSGTTRTGGFEVMVLVGVGMVMSALY